MKFCTHERPRRTKLGLNTNAYRTNFTVEKDYYCNECKWFVGYYTRLVMRI